MTLDKTVLAIILAGGKGSRLYNLTKERAKPALPFAGYRLIDIMLSNIINSDIGCIDLLTEYKSDSLAQHLSRWHQRLGLGEFVRVVPTQRRALRHFDRGSGDALYNHWYRREAFAEPVREYLVLSGDHVTDLRLDKLRDFHRKEDNDITITTKRVLAETARKKLGVVRVDCKGNVLCFDEKPEKPSEIPGDPGYVLANENNNVYRAGVLDNAVQRFLPEETATEYDQSKHIITPLVKEGQLKIKAFAHEGYWADVGTLAAFYLTNMELTKSLPEFNLYDRDWWYRTFLEKYIGQGVKVSGTMGEGAIANSGCIISGRVTGSVLSYGVETAPESGVHESVLFDRVKVGRGARVRRAIVDKDTIIGNYATINPDGIEIWAEAGEIRGNTNGYRASMLGKDHILLQKSHNGKEMPTDEEGYIPQRIMKRGGFLEAVVTPERIVALSKFSHVPEGYRL